MFSRLGFLTLVLCAQLAQAGQVYVVRPDGTDARRVTQDDDWAHGSPNWSPDGKQIAFDTWPEGPPVTVGAFFAPAVPTKQEQVQIGVVSFEGGPTKRIGHGAMPSWSPSGDQIVCHTYTPTQQIVVTNPDGSGREAILDQWGGPRWSPDGASIFSVYRGGVARYDLASGKQTILFSGENLREGFHYHAGTNRFCCRTMRNTLLVVEDDPKRGRWKPRIRLTAASEIGHASWSPDGKKIVFRLGDVRTYSRLALIDADGTGPPEQFPGLPAQWTCCNPRWSPDGEWIAFIRLDSPEFEADAEP